MHLRSLHFTVISVFEIQSFRWNVWSREVSSAQWFQMQTPSHHHLSIILVPRSLLVRHSSAAPKPVESTMEHSCLSVPSVMGFTFLDYVLTTKWKDLCCAVKFENKKREGRRLRNVSAKHTHSWPGRQKPVSLWRRIIGQTCSLCSLSTFQRSCWEERESNAHWDRSLACSFCFHEHSVPLITE